MLRTAAAQARRGLDSAERGLYAARRLRLLTAMRVAAERVHARLVLDVAPDVTLGRRVRVALDPGGDYRLSIGPGCRIHDDVLIRFSESGSVHLGPRVEIRRGVTFNVGGELILRGDNVLSWYTTIHCSQRVEIDEMASFAEHVSIADSRHYWTTPEEHFWHNVKKGDVYIGANTWLCPKVTVTRGARIGACCLVASNSVVTGEIPDGSFASGMPAVVRPNPLPWATTRAQTATD